MQANKVLSTLIRHKGVVMSKQEFIQALKSECLNATIQETPKVQWNRIKFNRMNGWEQEEYERKCNEMRTAYYIGGYEVSKTEYDYFHTL